MKKIAATPPPSLPAEFVKTPAELAATPKPAGNVPITPVVVTNSDAIPSPPTSFPKKNPSAAFFIMSEERKAIMAMQNSILELGQMTASNDMFSFSSDLKGNQEDRTGFKPVNTFLFENYVRPKTPEATLTSNVSDQTQKQIAENRQMAKDGGTSFALMIDTMRRIGGAGKEGKPDGQWGLKTNLALRNVFAFMKALHSFASDLEIKVSTPDFSLEKSIPTDPVPGKLITGGETKDLATKLAATIGKFKENFSTYVEAIKPLASQFSQDKPLFASKPIKPLTDEEKIKARTSSIYIDEGNGVDKKRLSLDDLKDLESFKRSFNVSTNEQAIEQIKILKKKLAISSRG